MTKKSRLYNLYSSQQNTMLYGICCIIYYIKKINIDGEIDYITGFTRTCAYIQDIDSNYITQKKNLINELMKSKKIKEA